ncbi:putative nuclease HARBI1 [Anneissia japonica]|uniref:putative nuclease HARBI1 n=1 Tax=Anneissia japonica TaxID=1529436 RepID=UPI00142555D4|nr:putative nuclease HARBI1 [Anneissia japonica]
MPQSGEDWRRIAQQFHSKWNFPNTLGAINGKHVALMAPNNSGSLYYNYKNFFSIVFMGLVDADYKFIYVDVDCNGRISDGGVFAGCTLLEALNRRLLSIPESDLLPGTDDNSSFHILGDEAFPLRTDLLKPFPFRNLKYAQRVFNYRLSRARRVENAFGILAMKFRVLLTRINLSPEKASQLVMAACTLHNYLRNDPYYVAPGLLDYEDNIHRPVKGAWRQQENPLKSVGLPFFYTLGVCIILSCKIKRVVKNNKIILEVYLLFV